MELTIFTIAVGIVLIFLMDFIGVHLPYTAKYLIVIIAVAIYALLTRIKDRFRRGKIEKS